MIKFRKILQLLTGCGFVFSGVFNLAAEEKVVTSIEIPASKTVYTMKYNSQGKLSELIFQKTNTPQFGSGHKITYPAPNTIVCETGGINFQKDQFDRFFTDKITINPKSGDFKVVNMSHLGNNTEESILYVTKEGVREDNARLISLKWFDNSISEIDWDGDIYEFKYSDKPYSVSQYGSWDWLMLIIYYIVPNDYLEYWYVGHPFAPFKRYPSEIIYKTDNEVTKYKIDYLFMANGNLTVDYICEINGETRFHSYITVNFSSLR
ncbi:MAG: hypothetical protein J1E78_06505 [Muribaculaceae bacterium]|nr:hypothetical protein [Muribaculaceae bacterium]